MHDSEINNNQQHCPVHGVKIISNFIAQELSGPL